MIRALLLFVLSGALLASVAPERSHATAAGQPTGRLLKVLPHLLDLQGRHTVSPSLFDRDAYQTHLRQHPEECSGIRYDVLWKGRNAGAAGFTVRVQLKGLFEGKQPREKTLEATITESGSLREWTHLPLTGDDYKQFGKITAWRATLWAGDQLLDEQKSFLW